MKEQNNITLGDQDRLFGYLEGTGKVILPEPQALPTSRFRMPGLDGQKMSESYNNTIGLRESADEVDTKIRRMPTDPARIRRNDPGDPENVRYGNSTNSILTSNVKTGYRVAVPALISAVWTAKSVS